MNEGKELFTNIFEHENLDKSVCEMKKYNIDTDLKANCESCTDIINDNNRVLLNCHGNVCYNCFKQWITIKIKDNDIMNGIKCPGSECPYIIPLYIYFDKKLNMTLDLLYQFCIHYCGNQLKRNENFVFCQNTKKCQFGFLLKWTDNEIDRKCEYCQYLNKKIKRKDAGKLTGYFADMEQSGEVKRCPVCKHPHMKDYGLCNVLKCGNCMIWWNWKTYEYDKSQKALKS